MKKLQGKIVSTKMQGTAVVKITRRAAHPVYNKLLKRSKKYKVEIGDVKVNNGDLVEILEIRPISKDKYFKITKVLEVAK